MSNILQNIFIDYYEHILYELHPRQTEIENISKMIIVVILLMAVLSLHALIVVN